MNLIASSASSFRNRRLARALTILVKLSQNFMGLFWVPIVTFKEVPALKILVKKFSWTHCHCHCCELAKNFWVNLTKIVFASAHYLFLIWSNIVLDAQYNCAARGGSTWLMMPHSVMIMLQESQKLLECCAQKQLDCTVSCYDKVKTVHKDSAEQ